MLIYIVAYNKYANRLDFSEFLVEEKDTEYKVLVERKINKQGKHFSTDAISKIANPVFINYEAALRYAQEWAEDLGLEIEL